MSEQKNFFERAFDNMRADAAVQHEIDRVNFQQMKEDSKRRFREQTAPNPDFQEFMAAKGFKAKLNVLLDQAERNSKQIREDERTRYAAMLQETRGKINQLDDKA